MKTIKAVFDPMPMQLGDEMITRALPVRGQKRVGPFIMIDHFGPGTVYKGKEKGVPPHPHRGFEPITLMLEGTMEHRDSAGNHGLVGPGDVQWMTAGSGILHAETPKVDGDTMPIHGLQIWVNLPKAHKMTEPKYQDIPSEKIPVIETEGSRLRVIAGAVNDVQGPASTFSPLTFMHGSLSAGHAVEIPIAPGFEAAVYLISGEVQVMSETVAGRKLLAFDDAGEKIKFTASQDAEYLVLAGEPLNEPYAQYGPFVMNTAEELIQAQRDFQEGKMGYLA
ncbi:MAG: pirin family protein [Bacteroidota bacterium]